MNHRVMRLKRLLGKRKLQMKQSYKVLRRRLHEIKSNRRTAEIKPEVLQLPITYKCNFDCVMCGMRSLLNNQDFTAADLAKIIDDPIFYSIKSVGINGGEPFLRTDLMECVRVLLTLPSLKGLYFISNGFFTDRILGNLKEIKKLCEEKGVLINVSISVDGIDDLQDKMRGHRNAFINAEKTCIALRDNPGVYCDHVNVISTITKVNISRIYEVDEWINRMGLSVAYNVATIHERIENDYKYEDFSVFTDERARHLAMEFFYGLFRKTKSERYFGIYYYIKTQKRIAYCDYMHNALTVIPNGNIAYCATHSKEIGNAIETKASDLYYSNLDYQKSLINTYCQNCSHYIYTLTAEGLKLYNEELLRIIG